MSSDIFISYAREDRARVQPIAEALARRGYGVWWDKGLRGGEDYRDRIEEMLKTARCVVVAWSKDSVQSDFVLDEAGRGHRRKVLLPVFIDEGIEPPLGFGGIHTSDLSGWLRDPSDPAPFEQFVDDVAAVLARDGAPVPVAPPPPAPPTGARKMGLLPVAIGGGALMVAAAVMYLGARDADVDIMSDMGQDTAPSLASVDTGPGRGPLSADGGTVPVRAGDGGAGNPALPPPPACATLSIAGGHPLEQRRRARTRPRFTVDTATHLLLDGQGAAVPGGAASSYGTMREVRFIVAHYSAGFPGATERYFQQPDVRASTHLMIARDGGVRQMLQLDAAAIHAGESRWRGVRRLNSYSIGIDMENWGRLSQRQGRWYPAAGRVLVPEDEVQVLTVPEGTTQVGWHRYTEAQLDAFLQVSCALRHAYPGIEDVVGHDSISPGRKEDPGPAFPIAAIRASLFPRR